MRHVTHRCLCLLLALAVGPVAAAGGNAADGPSPRQKALATELAVIGFIGAWGAANWDYGGNGWQTEEEGWFDRNTREGGADKAGHVYTGYVIGRSLAGLFAGYGYDKRDAARLGALGSLGVMTFMEMGDGFSPYGFSWEDQAMNLAGAGLAWLLADNPALARRVALRGEYRVHGAHTGDVLTDYDRWRYYLTLKLDGFEHLPPALRWLELHAGYYARGYADGNPLNNERTAFIGAGISLTKLARALGHPRTAVFLDYFQPPDTTARADHTRD